MSARSSSPARTAGSSADGRRRRSNTMRSRRSSTMPGSASTTPASPGCRRSTRAASPPPRSPRRVRASATRARPTRMVSSAASMRAPRHSASRRGRARANLSPFSAAPGPIGRNRHERSPAPQQPPLRPDERRPRHGRDAASRRGRADVRHGRLSALAVLRRARPARPAPFPDQRRALRRLCRRGLCAGHQPAGDLRRHARARRHQSRHRLDRGAERRNADRGVCRRHQPRAFLEEHDPGMPPGRDPAAGGQGVDPGRSDAPRSRTAAPRLRGRDLGAAGAGAARRSRGRLPRRARFRRRGFCDRPGDPAGAGPAHPARPRRHRPRRGADRARQAAAHPGRRRHSPLGRVRGARWRSPRRSRSRSRTR